MIRRLLSVLPCAALLVAVVSPGTPLLARLVILIFFGVTLWNPSAGLLAVAGVAPLGAFLIALDRIADFRLTEIILLSFIAAWLLRKPQVHGLDATRDEGPRLPRYAWVAAWLFSVLLASLCFALSRQLLRYDDALRVNLETIALHYFGYADPTGIGDAARMIEGFALVAATMELFRRKPALARSLAVALAVSAVVAAATSVLLWFGVGPAQILTRRAVIGHRFAAHVIDLNAAGSHFVLILCLALGFARYERGTRRAFWIAASIACGIGLWMSGSRTAEATASIVIPVAFLWAVTTAWPRTRRLSIISVVLGVLLVLGAVRAWQIDRDPTYTASGFRQQFVMSSFRVIGTHPYLGIGPGRYFRDSPNFLTPQLAWSYGSENAHNNYLQITTEEGIIGFFVYATFFAGALGLIFGALAQNLHDWRLLGTAAGIVAFLGTCLLGHPLLVREVATAFFLQLALAASLGGSFLLNRDGLRPAIAGETGGPLRGGRYRQYLSGPYARIATMVGTIGFAVLPAWTLEKPLVPVHLEEVDGRYYADEGKAEGVPFHWTRQYASLFTPRTARVVEIPLRAPQRAVSDDQIVVDISVDGVMQHRAIVGTNWSSVVLTLPSPEPPLLFNRINFQVNHAFRIADFTPGSTDRRIVGVQVGDFRILRVAWEFVPKPAEAQTPP